MFKWIRNWFVCWYSYWYNDIHQPSDDVKGIPDHFGEYTCSRCKQTFTE